MSSACVCHINPNECEWCLTGKEPVAEMIAERLENMGPISVDGNGNVLIKGEDWHWLGEQAERAIEYDSKLISLEDNKCYVSELREQNRCYCEALKKIKAAVHVIGCLHCSDVDVIARKELEVSK